MIEIIKENERLLLLYTSERDDLAWIDVALQEDGKVRISRRFTFTKDHLTSNGKHGFGLPSSLFILGTVADGYYVIVMLA